MNAYPAAQQHLHHFLDAARSVNSSRNRSSLNGSYELKPRNYSMIRGVGVNTWHLRIFGSSARSSSICCLNQSKWPAFRTSSISSLWFSWVMITNGNDFLPIHVSPKPWSSYLSWRRSSMSNQPTPLFLPRTILKHQARQTSIQPYETQLTSRQASFSLVHKQIISMWGHLSLWYKNSFDLMLRD